MKHKLALEEIVKIIRANGRVRIAELAVQLGYSYLYFKYSIVKTLLALHKDIVLVRENGVDYLVHRPQVVSCSG